MALFDIFALSVLITKCSISTFGRYLMSLKTRYLTLQSTVNWIKEHTHSGQKAQKTP